MRVLSLLVALLGCAMILATASAPRYEPEGWPDTVMEPGPDTRAASERFYAAQAEHRTQASRVQDVGRGVAALGASTFVLALLCGVSGWSSVRRWRSPRRAWMIWVAAAGSWLALAQANVWWLMYTGERGDYPWWADTVIIPIVSIYSLAVVGLPIIVVILLASLWRVSLPVMVADLRPSMRFWLATVGAAVATALLVDELVFDIRDGAALVVASEVLALGALLAWWPAAAARRTVASTSASSTHHRHPAA